ATAPRIDRAVNGLLKRLSAEGIEVRDRDEVLLPPSTGRPNERNTAKATEEVPSEPPLTERAKPAADPIQAYLGKMGSLSLLTREGDVEVARRVARGRQRILWALARSAVRMPEITELIERIEDNDIRMRDVLDGMTSSTAAQEDSVRARALRELKRLK